MYPKRLEKFGGVAAYDKSVTNVNLAMFRSMHFPGSCSSDQSHTPQSIPRFPSDFIKIDNQSIAGINHYVNTFRQR